MKHVLTFGSQLLGLVIGLEKLEDISEEAMDTMIDTNVKGLVHVTQSVLPGMRARNKGHIINIGSVAGHQAYANGSIYCGSKAAVASITRALLYETVDTAIRISEVNPGKTKKNRLSRGDRGSRRCIVPYLRSTIGCILGFRDGGNRVLGSAVQG